ncbi:MAG TPA: hypothetical protein VES20_14685 [Bryobacteraceae bacterium]|nr:hypothetical protein [Bryobacteraceae bacterium]
MKRRTLFSQSPAFSSGLAAAGFPYADAPAGPLLSTGFADRDITPDIGMEQPGGYGKAYLRKFHDPCKVRAAVFDDGSHRVALVGVDALVIPRHVVTAAREEIHARCGISPGAVMVGASHSHSSGPTGMVLEGEYDHASPLVRKLAYEHSSMANTQYLKRVQAEIVRAVCEADASRRPSACSFGTGREDKVAFNRRFRMRNGMTWTHPGQGNPDLLEPAGPIDPIVSVIGSYDAEGRLKGCVVNYACHATTSPDGISANWIYYLEKTIQGMLGPGATVVFLQGFCGDITQVDNRSPYQSPSGDEYARLVGGRVAAEAVRTLLKSHAGSAGPVASRSQTIRLARRKPSHERVKRCLDIVAQDPKQVGATEWIFAKEILMLDALVSKWPSIEAEVQALQVGPAAMVATPGEMFVELGLDIRKGSKFPVTMPVELANGSAGYVPTEEALGKRGGGYETRLTSYSNLEPTAGTRFVQASVQLLGELKPAPIPRRPGAAPFGTSPTGIGSGPWSYGNVPPELS